MATSSDGEPMTLRLTIAFLLLALTTFGLGWLAVPHFWPLVWGTWLARMSVYTEQWARKYETRTCPLCLRCEDADLEARLDKLSKGIDSARARVESVGKPVEFAGDERPYRWV